LGNIVAVIEMRVVNTFNMANDAYVITKGLRKLGVDAELIIQKPAHVASLPQWEDADIDLARVGDLYSPNWDALNERWKMPDWIHVWNASSSWYPGSRILRWVRLLRMLEPYDLVVGHFPFAKCAILCRKPYVIYDAGWIRYLNMSRRGYGLGRWGYRHASKIIFTNVDTYDMFLKQGYDPERLEFSPFAIDTDQYCPGPSRLSLNGDRDLMIFSPARHEWYEKGNDRLIKAFSRFVRTRPGALLVVVEWGSDLVRSKNLVNDLGIEKNVTWVPLMNKKRLVEWYRLSDIVADQFVLGAYGTTVPEAMSCAKPVLMYAEERYFQQWHGALPPVLSARSVDEILEVLEKLKDATLRSEIGTKGRDWVLQQHGLETVAKRQLRMYREVVEETGA